MECKATMKQPTSRTLLSVFLLVTSSLIAEALVSTPSNKDWTKKPQNPWGSTENIPMQPPRDTALHSKIPGPSFLSSSLLQEPTSSTEDDDSLAFELGDWEYHHHLLSRSEFAQHYDTIEASLKLIHKMAHQLGGGEDLVQEGVVALMQAMNHYPTLTHHYETLDDYVRRFVVSEMHKSVKEDAIVELTIREAHRIRHKFFQKHKKWPSLDQVAHILQLEPSVLAKYEHLHRMKRILSVAREGNILEEDKDVSEKKKSRWEISPDVKFDTSNIPDELTPEEDALHAMVQTDLTNFLLHNLNEVELQIIQLRFGLRGPAKSRKDTAKLLQTTKAFVETIELQALQKLRTSYERRYMDSWGQYVEESV
jgi:RNA polymerase sigma factor (sigma-70 family)